MKVKITIEKTSYEHRIIEMDEKFRDCALPLNELDSIPLSLFEEVANEASRIVGLPLYGDGGEPEKGFITAGECVDNGELMFEI